MGYQYETKLVANELSKEPFSKKWSVIQLHDEISPATLFDTTFEVAGYLDSANKNSIFLQPLEPEEKISGLVEYLGMLKCPDALENSELMFRDLMALNREAMLAALSFMLTDIESKKKRSYLAMFLIMPDLPIDLAQDEKIQNLQQEFKSAHQMLESIKPSGRNATTIKREIQQMEEEKQQILVKIRRIQKKAESMPQANQWIQTAQNLRAEQNSEINLLERIKEQKRQIEILEKKFGAASKRLDGIKASSGNLSPEQVFTKMKEEHQMNKFLAHENSIKLIGDATQKLGELQEIIAKKHFDHEDFQLMQKELSIIDQKNLELTQEKMKLRQQANIIARKKESTLLQIPSLEKELQSLEQELKSKQPSSDGEVSMPQGDEFQKFVSELRGLTTNFKRKKRELDALIVEKNILENTCSVLDVKKQSLLDEIRKVEKEAGIVGFHETKTSLEMVSSTKTVKDEEKEARLQEISEIVENLTRSINNKKTLLEPVIQNLRELRQESQALERKHAEKNAEHKLLFSALESEHESVLKDYKEKCNLYENTQNELYKLKILSEHIEIAQERAKTEMKAYIGADDMVEQIQKQRGFKTYREMYNRKIRDLENEIGKLKDQKQQIQVDYEPNLEQIKMFNSACKLLMLKQQYNQNILNGGRAEEGIKSLTADRLVLSSK